MRTVTVTALRAFEYDGRTIEPGEHVKMSVLQAASQAYQRNISLTKVARPTYQTRDMVAAPVVAEIIPPPLTQTRISASDYLPPDDSVTPPRRRGRPRRTSPDDSEVA